MMDLFTVTSLKAPLTQISFTHSSVVYWTKWNHFLALNLLLWWRIVGYIRCLRLWSSLRHGKCHLEFIWSFLKSGLPSSGMRYEFLPPLSPEFNPIELAFSAMRYNLRAQGEYIRMATTDISDTDIRCTLLLALYEIGMADVFGWYRYCGYV